MALLGRLIPSRRRKKRRTATFAVSERGRADWEPVFGGTPPRTLRPALSFDQRLTHCLGALASIETATFRVDTGHPQMIGRTGMDRAAFEAAAAHYASGRRFLTDHPERRRSRLFRTYVAPVSVDHGEIATGHPFLVFVSDNVEAYELPTLVKSRPAGFAGLSVLFPLNYAWHFGSLGKVEAADMPFEKKARRLVWRGKTTGLQLDRPGSLDRGSRSFVPQFNARNTNPAIDLGFSHLTPSVDNLGDAVLTAALRTAVKETLSLEEHLGSRYLLSLEGHDVASGLKWMLASNSVVLMPRPRCESWACERHLEPFVHYVPVRPDLSDLEEAFAWCLDNDAACRRISANARAFMAPFLDAGAERALTEAVLEAYFAKVRLVPGDGLDARLLA
ncbi:hypothetical protein DLJ53_24995 [Acuticoccus sediminis]|uniref:Glycosyl transferase CAP10 domain-containing protein n=1 Tax=Acuticoccus sediminis TaxID=2184697 RepID=A0A8B2NHS8_9HYPH|nr:glycosyl transferase family 90 [Acuticoccus sediminis]RAH98892.1 hypothetical protein DLJ53_24995 [Acuticoccus sediminis]